MTHYKLTKEIFPNIYEVYDNPNLIAKTYSDVFNKKEEENRLRRIQHIENVSKIVDTTDNIIFLERAIGDDLYVVLSRRLKLSEKECKYISYKLLCIVKELHDLDIVHGDIKPENIIYDEISRELTLVDFEGNRTTKQYTSPENVLTNSVLASHDIWCIGTTIYTLMFGCNPYKNTNHLLSRYKYNSIKGVSVEAENFISFMLVKNSSLRPTVDQCLNHPWFDSISTNIKLSYKDIYFEYYLTLYSLVEKFLNCSLEKFLNFGDG